MQIIHPNSAINRVDNYKLIWCPFIPTKDDNNGEDDPFKLLALLNGKKGEYFLLYYKNKVYRCGRRTYLTLSTYPLLYVAYVFLHSYTFNGGMYIHIIIIMLLFTAEVWDIGLLSRECSVMPVEAGRGDSYLEINHREQIVDASFSPDSTVLATACSDGYVKIYQVRWNRFSLKST